MSRRTAIHESGHAVAALRLGLRVVRVELTPDHPDRRGRCGLIPGSDRYTRALVLLAGAAAELVILGRYDATGAQDDIAAARALVGMAGVAELWEELVELFHEPAMLDAVERIAGWLKADGHLSGHRCRQLFAGAIEDHRAGW